MDEIISNEILVKEIMSNHILIKEIMSKKSDGSEMLLRKILAKTIISNQQLIDMIMADHILLSIFVGSEALITKNIIKTIMSDQKLIDKVISDKTSLDILMKPETQLKFILEENIRKANEEAIMNLKKYNDYNKSEAKNKIKWDYIMQNIFNKYSYNPSMDDRLLISLKSGYGKLFEHVLFDGWDCHYEDMRYGGIKGVMKTFVKYINHKNIRSAYRCIIDLNMDNTSIPIKKLLNLSEQNPDPKSRLFFKTIWKGFEDKSLEIEKNCSKDEAKILKNNVAVWRKYKNLLKEMSNIEKSHYMCRDIFGMINLFICSQP